MASRYQHVTYSFGGPLTGAVKWLMAACVGVWVVQQVVPALDLILGLVPALATRGFVWQLGTYLFLHDGVLHLAINMLMLWMFGGQIERYWGARKFVIYFLLTGVGAALLILLAWATVGIGGAGSDAMVVVMGASGSIFGIIVAWALMFPDQEAYLIPFPVAIRAKWFAAIMIGIELAVIWSATGNVGGALAHLGGALTGYIYLEKLRGMPRLRGAYTRWRNRRIAKKFRVVVNENFLSTRDEDDRRSFLN